MYIDSNQTDLLHNLTIEVICRHEEHAEIGIESSKI
jgi:hypothetical protein